MGFNSGFKGLKSGILSLRDDEIPVPYSQPHKSQRHWQVTLQSLDANTQLTSPLLIRPMDPI